MRVRLWPVWLATLLTGIAAALGARAGAPQAPVPAVDLTRLTLGAHTVIARTSTGGVAELTLDPKLEAASRRLLSRARPFEGAVVAVDVKSGRVLAWAESRDGVITHARAPAASVFKVVTAAALFETERAEPSDRVCIAAGEHSGERGIEREHLEPPAHGAVCRPLSEALGFSRNAVFAQLATRHLLRTDLIDTAERIGFNGDVPFDWPAMIGSLTVPYNDLEFARAATGFRGSTLSPLGGAYIAVTIARGGLPVRLRLVARTDDFEAPDVPESLPRSLNATTAYRLTRMMEVTVHSGTARAAFSGPDGRSLLPGIRVAGKTGTLRPGTSSNTTSWFIGFAPSRQPEVAISVLLNNGPVWHNRAAEVARDVLRAYFRGRGVPGIADPLEPAELVSRRP